MDAFFDWRWGIIKKKMTLGIKSATLWKKILIAKPWGITFHSLLVTRWKLLVACNSLQNYSLLVANFARCKKSLVTRCKICSLLVAEVARCKKSIVTPCKIRSLLVAEVARCKNSLVTRCKNSLVTRCKICSLLLTELARCKKSLVYRCKIRSLLVAKVARCKNSLVTRCKIRSLLVAEVARCKNLLVVKKHSLLVAKFDRDLLHKVTKKSQLNLVMDGKIQMNLNLSIEYFT